MRKLLIFATLVLIFAFATQKTPVNKTKKNRTKTYNVSKLFNRTKVCRPGTVFNNKTKKCEKIKIHVRDRFKPVNKTNCTKGFALKCKVSKKDNKTWCFCKSTIPRPKRNITDKKKCKKGETLRCTRKFGKLDCSCKKTFVPVIGHKDKLLCEVGYRPKCTMVDGVKDCKCVKKKTILPTPTKILY